MATENPTSIQPLSKQDILTVEDLKSKALLSLFKLYGVLFLGLIFTYYQMHPGGRYRGKEISYGKLTQTDYNHIYEAFASFFGAVFLFFLIRDFRRMIIPLILESKRKEKNCLSFYAVKYQDPIYKKLLIFYPGKDNYYIELSAEDFQLLQDGEKLYLETGCVTGEILSLKNDKTAFSSASEFNFND